MHTWVTRVRLPQRKSGRIVRMDIILQCDEENRWWMYKTAGVQDRGMTYRDEQKFFFTQGSLYLFLIWAESSIESAKHPQVSSSFSAEAEETTTSSWSEAETFSSIPLLFSLLSSLVTPNVLMVSDRVAAPGPNTTCTEAALNSNNEILRLRLS